jgi:nucleoside-diphosphate-sugar epimerase
VSAIDSVRAVEAAMFRPGIQGIYHVGDERPVTVQEFLDLLCREWGYPGPVRVPFWMIYAAACVCESITTVAKTPSPLTRDIVRLGRVSHWGDTWRAREELIPDLVFPSVETGRSTL